MTNTTHDPTGDPHPDTCTCRGCRFLAYEAGKAPCETCDDRATVERVLSGGLGTVYLCAACAVEGVALGTVAL